MYEKRHLGVFFRCVQRYKLYFEIALIILPQNTFNKLASNRLYCIENIHVNMVAICPALMYHKLFSVVA